MDEEEKPAIVIDLGSGTCHAGFAGDDAPRSVFSSVVGFPRFPHKEIELDHMVGDHAQESRELLSLRYPIQRGIVTNWDDTEKLLEFCFKDLHVSPEDIDSPVLISEPIFNPSGNKQKMCETMFERFQVPGFFPEKASTLNLFASGRGVGIILDIGEGLTQLVPIDYSSPTLNATFCQELGGRDVTTYLQQLLQTRGYSFTTSNEWELVREIKEELGYVSLDFSYEDTEETKFSLPDGNKFTIGKEKFECAECLFQPELLYPENTSLKGLQELLQSCLENIDMDNRKDLYCNLILCGGGTLMSNFRERLEKAWKAVVPKTMVLQTVAKPGRKYNTWIGGSIEASLSTFQKAWITKEDYEEYGPTVVHRRTVS